MFFHEASTEKGSSGSPIVLKNDDRVLGIHKGAIEGKEKNIGIFIGDIVESLKEYKKGGKGKDYYEDGKIKYEGNFEDDEYNDDKGKFYDENGNKYEGKFTKGKKNGEFSVYEGDLKKDLKEGKGIYYWNNGNRYEGDWKNDLKEGKGIYYWNDGRRYEGDWKIGKREGKGILYGNNGDRYEGDFKNGKFEGKGKYYYNNEQWKKGGKGKNIL